MYICHAGFDILCYGNRTSFGYYISRKYEKDNLY